MGEMGCLGGEIKKVSTVDQPPALALSALAAPAELNALAKLSQQALAHRESRAWLSHAFWYLRRK